MAMSTLPLARTPLHHWHSAHNARFIDSDGWRLPAVYSTVEKETAAARAGLGLADISAFAKISLLGRNVPALTQALLGDGPAGRLRGVTRFAAGGPVLACRLTEDQLLLLAATTDAAPIARQLANLPEIRTLIQHDVTTALAGFQLIGPQVEALLRQLTPLDVSPTAFPNGTLAETSLAGVQALLVRVTELELPSMRIYVSWDLGEYVWGQILEAGRHKGLTAVGIEALRSLVTGA